MKTYSYKGRKPNRTIRYWIGDIILGIAVLITTIIMVMMCWPKQTSSEVQKTLDWVTERQESRWGTPETWRVISVDTDTLTANVIKADGSIWELLVYSTNGESVNVIVDDVGTIHTYTYTAP